MTELVTGLDLVRAPARGRARRARCPRRRSCPPPRGHAIEVRLYAEDPERGFAPSTGVAAPLRDSTRRPGLRVDAGVEDGSEVSVHYDPMLAKVIAWARDARRGGGEARRGARARAHPRRRARTATCWCGSCATPSSWPARPTRTSSSGTRPAVLGAPLRDAAGERAPRARRRARAPGRASRERARARGAAVGLAQRAVRGPGAGLRAARRARASCAYRFARDGLRARVGGESVAGVARSTRRRPRRSSSRPPACGGATRCTAPASASSWTARSARARSARCRASPSRRRSSPRARSWRRCPGLVKQVCVAVGDAVAKGDALRRARGDEDGAGDPRALRRPRGRALARARASRSRRALVLAVIEEEGADG